MDSGIKCLNTASSKKAAIKKQKIADIHSMKFSGFAKIWPVCETESLKKGVRDKNVRNAALSINSPIVKGAFTRIEKNDVLGF